MGWTPPAQELLLASSASEPFTHTRGAIMSKLTIAVDLAKDVFEVAVANGSWKAALSGC
jgi:hypothetical protein